MALSQRDLFLAGRREAILSPTRFDKTIIDTDGSDVNVVLNASATMGEEVVRYLITRMNALAISTATGEDLRRRGFDFYGLLPHEASSAVVTLELTRTSEDGYTVAAGSRFGTAGGVTFRTITDVAFPDNNLGPLSVIATAERAGVSGNVAEDTITRVLSALGDNTLLVTNPEAAAGGSDGDTDDTYRSDLQQFFVTARRGTKDAIEFGARLADGVVQATAIELLDATSTNPNGRVQLYISDASGQANTALSDLVEIQLAEYRGLGVPVTTVPAVPQYVDIIVEGLEFQAGANTNSILDQAATTILAVVNSLSPGETLRRSSILGALTKIDLLVVPDDALTEPAGDLIPTTGTIIRTTRDRIQVSG